MKSQPKTKAPIGIEPMYKGFADLSLTTWVRRQMRGTYYLSTPLLSTILRNVA